MTTHDPTPAGANPGAPHSAGHQHHSFRQPHPLTSAPGPGSPSWEAQTGTSTPMAATEIPGLDPAHAAAVVRLHTRLQRELATGLTERIRDDEQSGRPLLRSADRREFAAHLLSTAADHQAQVELDTGGVVVSPESERRVIDALLTDMFEMGGLQPLLADTRIENINITGDRVFVRYASGQREQRGPITGSDAELVGVIRELAARSGVEERRFDRGAPIVNFALPGGERASAVMAVTARPSLSIRRHRFTRVTLAELTAQGTLDRALESFLGAAVRARKNILVTGGVAIGKTTLLRALAAAIGPQERLVTIEDVFELGLDGDPAHPDVVAMQAREANIEGQGAVSQSELVWQALRMSPDRVIVGEVRGPVVLPLTNAMSMGNDGSMGTLHASTSAGAFTKLAAYAVQGPERLTLEATNLLVASALHFVVHLAAPRDDPTRRVISSVREVVGAEGPQVVSNEIWRPDDTLRAIPAAPVRTDTVNDLLDAGFAPELRERPDGWWTP